MICVECSNEVPSLYTEFSNGYIKLTYCNNCNAVADKYVEFDLVILFIDILLLKPQAYKHLIFNTLLFHYSQTPASNEQQEAYNIQHQIHLVKDWMAHHAQFLRLTISFLLFEIYLNWAYEELKPQNTILFNIILHQSTMVQYFFFFAQCISEFVVGHLVVQTLVWLIYKYDLRKHNGTSKILYSKEAISTTVLIAGGTKLYPILMLIWPYDSQLSTSLINNYFTNLTLIEALRITISLTVFQSISAVLVALVFKKFASTVILIALSKTFSSTEFASYSAAALLQNEINHLHSTVYNLLLAIKKHSNI